MTKGSCFIVFFSAYLEKINFQTRKNQSALDRLDALIDDVDDFRERVLGVTNDDSHISVKGIHFLSKFLKLSKNNTFRSKNKNSISKV